MKFQFPLLTLDIQDKQECQCWLLCSFRPAKFLAIKYYHFCGIHLKRICISYLDAKMPGCDVGQRLLSFDACGRRDERNTWCVRLDNIMMKKKFPRHAEL